MKDIHKIDSFIQTEMAGGKSLFQIALGLDDETRLTILDWKLPGFFPYARVASWFIDFFENSDGQNYLQASWNEDERRGGTPRQCWQAVFPDVELTNASFKAQCWLLDNKEKGRTSHLWYGLKKCLDLPSDSRFNIEAYDNPPDYLTLLLMSYQRGEPAGTDFADFVEAFEGDVNPGLWHHRIFDASKEKFHDRANVGVYLHWSGGVSIGMGVGIDRIRGTRSTVLYFNGHRVDVPRRNKFYGLDGYRTKVTFAGMKAIEVSPEITGVFYRYVSDIHDSRSSWWKIVPEDGVIPFSKDELLVSIGDRPLQLTSGTHDGVVVTVEEPFDLHVRNVHQNCHFRLVRILISSRPTRTATLEITEGLSIKVAARIPKILITEGESERLSSGDMSVCRGDCKFTISDLDAEHTCLWQVNEEERDDIELILSEATLGNNLHRLKVKCKILGSDGTRVSTLVRHVVWLPSKLASQLEQCGEVRYEGWKIKKSSDGEEIIRDRIRNRVRYYLAGPNGRSEQVYALDEGMFFWFAHGMADWDENVSSNEPKDFTFKGDAEGWYVCLPGNLQPPNFSFEGVPLDNQTSEPVNGVWRIPLLKLLPQDRDFVYNGDIQIQTLSCNGRDVARFGNAPLKAFLCKDSVGNWGVYIPHGDTKCYKAVVYTDNTLNDCFLNPLVRRNLYSKDGIGSFYSLTELLSQQTAVDKDGELFLALMTDDEKHPELMIQGKCFDADCQMRLIRPKSELYGLEQKHELLNVFHTMLEPKVPHGHIWLYSRLARYAEPLKLEDVERYWEQFVQTGVIESLPEILYRMLMSNYNFLAEAKWFYGALGQMEEGCRRQMRLSKITIQVRKRVNRMLIDNQDKEEYEFKGAGWCPAVLAQRKIDSYEKLVCEKDKFKLREITRLDNNFQIREMGVRCKFRNHWNQEFDLNVSKFNEGCVELDGQHDLFRDRRSGQWNVRRRRFGRIDYANDLSVVRFDVDVELYLRTAYGRSESLSRECYLIEAEGLSAEQIERLKIEVCSFSQQLRNGLGEFVAQVLYKVFSIIGVCDESCLILTGLAIAVLVTIGRMGNVNRRPICSEDAYSTLTLLVRIYFEQKKFEDNVLYWRRLMREIVANMRLFAYLNIEVN